MARFTTEDDEGVTNFVDFHGFATNRTFRVGEREEFLLFGMRKSDGAFAVFVEILLIVVLIMTVFVDEKPHFGQEGFWFGMMGYLLLKFIDGCPFLE